MVTDLSVKGARLDFSQEHRLPTVFKLTVPSIGFANDVTLRYQSDGRVGVQFADETPAANADETAAAAPLTLPVKRKPRLLGEPQVKEYSGEANTKCRGIIRR